jgi:hypothetical protein
LAPRRGICGGDIVGDNFSVIRDCLDFLFDFSNKIMGAILNIELNLQRRRNILQIIGDIIFGDLCIIDE